MIQSFTKFIFTFLLIMVGTLGVSSSTQAYFTDTETSADTAITAGIVDFRLTRTVFDVYVGKEYEGEKRTVTVAVPNALSQDMQYVVKLDTLTPALCDQFTVRVKRNENLVYEGLVSNFSVATTSQFGTWDFTFDMPLTATLNHGDLCAADFTYTAWSIAAPSTAVTGFYDVETLSTKIRAKTIVMNEVLADPDITAPFPANREFIELKNIGGTPVDIAGWQISEIAGATEVRRAITASSANVNELSVVGGNTIVPAGGYAVVIFYDDNSYLDDTGDTIKLYESATSTKALEAYTYESSLYGKSDARLLPDGIGAWVDPVPTPGTLNIPDLSETTVPNLPASPPATLVNPGAPLVTAQPTAGGQSEPVVTDPVIDVAVDTDPTDLSDLPNQTDDSLLTDVDPNLDLDDPTTAPIVVDEDSIDAGENTEADVPSESIDSASPPKPVAPKATADEVVDEAEEADTAPTENPVSEVPTVESSTPPTPTPPAPVVTDQPATL